MTAIEALRNDIDVFFAEEFLKDMREDFGSSAEQALAGFRKLKERALTAEPVPPDRERLLRDLEELRRYLKNSGLSIHARDADLVIDEAAALLRQPAPAEVEALAKNCEEAAVDPGPWVPDVLRSAAALLRRLALPAVDWRPTHRHYKGGLYREIARGRIEADLSPIVIYDNDHGETWVRPVADFDGIVTIDGTHSVVLRFTPIPDVTACRN